MYDQGMKIFYSAFMLVMVTFLQGCLNVATSGAEVVYNRHSIQKNINNQYLTMQAYQALYMKTDEFKNANIAISTYNNEILLAGQVPAAWQKTKAEQIVKKIPDVDSVYNLITVESPSSTLTRVSDAWITTKVKTKLLASNDIDATKVKVVTENGTVFLMGILLPEEADTAIDLARNTDGVQKVVKMFSYVSISKQYNSRMNAGETKEMA
jgi:osmotically-inducible protein OsmY